jgi:hypothetical protein
MKEIKTVERAVVSGMTDMMAMMNKEEERMTPAPRARGRRPKRSEVKKAPRTPSRPMRLTIIDPLSKISWIQKATVLSDKYRNGLAIPASWKKSSVSSRRIMRLTRRITVDERVSRKLSEKRDSG